MQQQFELHIDELVLLGFSTSQRYAIAETIQMELTRLFTEQQIPRSLQRGGTIPSINGIAFNVNKESKAESTGKKIANAVYNSFGK